MENKNPCLTCTRVKDPHNCENKNCREWREWFVRKWEELRMPQLRDKDGRRE